MLTIPGFHWTKANTTGSPRWLHACATTVGRQMVSVGGLGEVERKYDETTSDDPWKQGIGVLDMKTLAWQSEFDPNGAAYESPDAIKAWYENG